ncbi:probable inactive receptor kinase At2g26730 [Zingiber officinale]|uniref:probable inactive receptor kinase At2g26730 n=1 Tax=Zingiber officinale TaxID=94328 RepID=UPI001C4ACFFB|nr:probable inactive receptor kinase At2g26730 [Zingiber officinale]
MELLPLLLLVILAGSGDPSSPVRAAVSDLAGDRSALLDFMAPLRHEPRLQWRANASACDWAGVTCDSGRTAVLGLHLPGVGLVGSIADGTLGRLSMLRVLSLRANRLSGPIPVDLASLTQLRGLFLQGNIFSGSIPPGLSRLTLLFRLDLSSNNLTGTVPFAVNNLTRLTGLFLENNRLSGNLPSISIASLDNFNVSHNEFNGSIPPSLQRFPAASFEGNLGLCGAPLLPCIPFFPSPAPSPDANEAPTQGSSKRLSTEAIVAIVVSSITGLLLLMLLLLVLCVVLRRRRKRAGRTKEKSAKRLESATVAAPAGRSGETGITSSSKDEMSGSGGTLVEAAERNKLVFVRSGAGYSFDLEDLLRASAEVLGKGSTGTSYKAVLEEGATVVVKRLKDVSAAKPEFESHLHTLGQVEHPNLLAPRAYYYSKDEKLLVLDYLPAGSLSSLLHGNRGAGRTPLSWERRIRVALAAGRGLCHLHTSAHLVHGNVKASNVLLRADDVDSAVLSDFALHPIFNSGPRHRLAGYRAPEVQETRRHTFKSDVYSFGVLLLELLTGKAPNQASLGEEGIDLPRWVQSVVREEWTAEVFDVELMRYPDTEEEMVQLLQIAMACVASVPDARPDLPEAVRLIEQIVSRTEGEEGLTTSPVEAAKGGGDAGGGIAPPAAGATL